MPPVRRRVTGDRVGARQEVESPGNKTEAPSPKEVEGLAVEHCDHAS